MGFAPLYPSYGISLFRLHQRRIDQRAIAALGKCLWLIEAEPFQRLEPHSVRWLRHPLPQQSGQTQRGSLCVAQQLQRRDQPLLDLGKISAERK